jgi:ribosomal protein L11 methyltransferase
VPTRRRPLGGACVLTDPALLITARGPREAALAAWAAIEGDPSLEAIACSIIEEDESRGLWRIDAWPASAHQAQAFRARLARHDALQAVTTKLADADWLAMALSGLPPVRAGRFLVLGAHDLGRAPINAIKVRIEAGAAFGTGHHATTLGCLLALDGLLKTGRWPRVLDIGCGTGVLAIAAARAGSITVLGADIDPDAVRIARDNARINGVRARFVLADGLAHAFLRRARPYDLVLANVLAGPLVRMSPTIGAAVRRGGAIVLSGLLRSQARTVLAAYRDQGLRLARRIGLEAWTTLVLRRR